MYERLVFASVHFSLHTFKFCLFSLCRSHLQFFAVLLPIPFQIKTAVSLANPSPRIVVPSLNKTDLVSTKAVLSTQATVIPADRPRTTSPPPSAMSKMVSDDSSANPLPLPYRPYQSTEDTASPSTQANTDDGVPDKCANCAGPANHCCARCIDGVDLHGKKTPTFYCSTACKHIHWITHRIECGLSIDRGQLYKIGSLLQWAFYGARKVTWHAGIERVKNIEGSDGANMVVWCNRNQDSAHYARFPDATFDEEREKQAVLAYAASGVTIVAPLMAALLEGVCCLSLVV
jgi:hypothetical protein